MKDVDPRCSFCRIVDPVTVQRDSFNHCFYLCPVVRKYLIDICSLIGITDEYNSDNFKKMFWYGLTRDSSKLNLNLFCYILFFDAFRYLLYKHRRRHHIPRPEDLLNELQFFLNHLCKANKKIKNAFLNISWYETFQRARG
jgi:hypothetical protein